MFIGNKWVFGDPKPQKSDPIIACILQPPPIQSRDSAPGFNLLLGEEGFRQLAMADGLWAHSEVT